MIFEFQTLVCQLTGMDIANASMYDGRRQRPKLYYFAERVTKMIESRRLSRTIRNTSRSRTPTCSTPGLNCSTRRRSGHRADAGQRI